MTDDRKLYGRPGAEHMDFDPTDTVQSYVDQLEESDHEPFTIEEWSIRPPIDHIPSAESFLENLAEAIADEMDEDGWDHMNNIVHHPDVVAIAESLRTAIASKVGYFMAHELLRTLTVTWDGNTVLLDGEPLYEEASR